MRLGGNTCTPHSAGGDGKVPKVGFQLIFLHAKHKHGQSCNEVILKGSNAIRIGNSLTIIPDFAV